MHVHDCCFVHKPILFLPFPLFSSLSSFVWRYRINHLSIFLVCNHVTRRPCWMCVDSQYNRIFSRRIYMKIGYGSQRREMLLFWPPTWPPWRHVQTSNNLWNTWHFPWMQTSKDLRLSWHAVPFSTSTLTTFTLWPSLFASQNWWHGSTGISTNKNV